MLLFPSVRLVRLLVFVAGLLILTTVSAFAFDSTPDRPAQTAAKTDAADDGDFVSNALYDSAVEATRIGDYARAIRLLTKVIEMKPDFAEAYRERGWARLYQGAAIERIAPCTRALRTDPRSPEKFLERGNAEFGAGNYDAALADYNEAANLRPDDPEPCLRRSRVYLSRGERDRSRKEWEAYIRKAKARDENEEKKPLLGEGNSRLTKA